jgi:glycosyltransferase involved in cell wall biosynthesis
MMHSIVLTVHNKDFLIDSVMNAIYENTLGSYELIIVLDGCTDNSEELVLKNKRNNTKIIYTPDVFETKANNAGIKESSGDYIIIVQDDMIVNEKGWNQRLQKPFDNFDDVFAVTARASHNFGINENSRFINMIEHIDNEWSDIFYHPDLADRLNTPRNIFAIRDSVNRGPLMINHKDMILMNYFDEEFAPQELDDHDLCYRVKEKLGKVVGCYWIDYLSELEWGGTRAPGSSSWITQANQKNSKIFYKRHRNSILNNCVVENRWLP